MYLAADHKVKMKKDEKLDKYLDLARELKKLENLKGTVIAVEVGALGKISKNLKKKLDDQNIRGRNHSNHNIYTICEDTLKNPGELGRFVVT